jgi:fermentation-respiration switch protein FrsA (DUF1100 family)
MKRVLLIIIMVAAICGVKAQSIAGDWSGRLSVQGISLRLIFHIAQAGDGYTATMDSPDQGANGIPVTSVTFANATLKIDVTNLGMRYEGRLTGDSIVGTFKQGNVSLPMNLSQRTLEKDVVSRPQDPVKPYPYHEEEVRFRNGNITLAGTLTLPAKDGKDYPAVVLISGSGAQDRNEETSSFNHRPFLVLSDFLTRNGIAVLRYDDRGSFESMGNFEASTTADFADDAEAAVKYLQTRKEIDKTNIGLIGHSEGGMIAPMIASRNKGVAFIVLMAGPGVRGDQLLLAQQEALAKVSGISDDVIRKNAAIQRKAFDIVLKSQSLDEQKPLLEKYLYEAMGESNKAAVQAELGQLNTPFFRYFIRYDPAPALEKVTCPVLAINGDKDVQVPAAMNLERIRTSLAKGGNKRVTIKELKGLNHLFQECTTGSPAEYARIEQTLSPAAMTTILNQIKQTVQ